jgi:uncharacterized membrane protein YphA (DoxX/SURF4 family)
MVHEGRADFAMWFGLLFLLIVGAGKFSLDAKLADTGRNPDARRPAS